jgi:FMN-dependent NADH-azoreductase
LAESEALIAEIEAAEAIVIGTPLYNFGMPAVLKLWIEQIVRVDRSFEIVSGASGETYRPLLKSKPVVVVVAAGNGAFLSGGPLAALNFLESHLGSVLTFLGFTEVTFVRISETDAKNGTHSPELSVAMDRLRALPPRERAA